MKVSRLLFYAVLLALPLNLGKHFVLRDAYVMGLLINYLLPVVYLQDILISLLLVSLTVENWRVLGRQMRYLLSKDYVRLVIFFLFCMLLSVVSAERVLPSLSAFLRLMLYAFFGVYVAVTFKRWTFERIAKGAAVLTCLVSLLAVIQFVQQGSVFDNYLFFGEQPYSTATPDILKENVLGVSTIPPYGLFSHPNVFGGLLSITLVWLLSRIRHSKLYLIAVVLGLCSLLLTVSFFSIVAFLLGALLMNCKKFPAFSSKLAWGAAGLAVVGLLIVKGPYATSNPSFYRREALLKASLHVAKDHPLFGAGLNNLTVVIERYLQLPKDIRFVQPVHNIFILVLTEAGIFALVFFVSIIQRGFSASGRLTAVSLFQLVFLGSFDHYFLTIHQPQLLLWVILGIALSEENI